MNDLDTNSGNWASNNARNTSRLRNWTGAWLLSMAVATFGPIFLWENTSLTLALILLNMAIGFGMIWANKLHLKGLDEMHQKVQLEAMALSLGVGLVVGLAYSNLDIANIIASDAEISHLVMLMGLTYLFGVIGGLRKYR
jgi:hypothetical protein